MSAMSGEDQYRVTKKVRKGTRSCWECKRRKIKCIYDGNEPICVGCLDRATPCISQEHPPDDQGSSSGSRLGARMGRVEALLEKLMEKMDAGTPGDPSISRNSSLPPLSKSLGIDVIDTAVSGNHFESAPIMTLFEHSAFAPRNPVNTPGQPTPPDSQHSSVPTPPYGGPPPSRKHVKLDSVRRALASLLPTQMDVDKLGEVSRGWWLIKRHVLPELYRMDEDNNFDKPLSVLLPSDGHPTVYARLLLSLAICIQQLPSTFDSNCLQMKSAPALMEKIISTVYALVVSDDELVGSPEGLECLILSVVYQLNAGNLRRAWLNSRRTIAVATLMGMHRQALIATSDESPLSHYQSLRTKYLWFQIVKMDRYLALILGLPSGVGDAFVLDPNDDSLYLSREDSYQRKLCMIAGLVLGRNDAPSSHAYAATQEIDEKLDLLSKELPASWWELPTVVSVGKTESVAQQLDVIISHIFHFQIEAHLHIPFMIKSANERRYEYSKFSCLRASREMVKRWLFLRVTCNSSYVCEILDFQAFTMAVTLLLGLLGPGTASERQQREDDRAMVVKVMNVLEAIRHHEFTTIASQTEINHTVASQSVEVLKTLLNNLDLNDPSHAGFLKLTIPHFGTVSIARGPTILCPEGVSMGINNTLNESPADWQQMPPPQTGPTHGGSQQGQAMLSFTSSQFPLMAEGSGPGNFWDVNDADMMLFDSLISTDVEGSWRI